MNATLTEEPMVYQIRVKGYLDWRFWQDSFGVQVGEEGDGVFVLRGTVADRPALTRLIARLRYEGAAIQPPVFLTSVDTVR